MKKFSLVYFPCFAVTFFLGFGLTNAFTNPTSQNAGFSRDEAIFHLNKRVQSLCNAKFVSVEQTNGVTEMTQNLGGENLILVDWHYSLRGKHELIWYRKEEYEKCVVEIGGAER